MYIKSVYPDHYRGLTYKVAAAYLRVRSDTDSRAPVWAGRESLKNQRKMIAQAAKQDQTIIVAEFIDHAQVHRTPLEGPLGTWLEHTGVSTFYVVNRDFLAESPDRLEWTLREAAASDIAIREVEM